jgi:predicted nucleic acid-binding protein
MFRHVVLDTSVIVKWFRQGEVLADKALALRTAYLEGHTLISAPTLIAYELANALRYKNDLTTDQVEDAVQSLFDLELEWVSPSARVMRRAVVTARESDVSVYDATFVALAELQNAIFITADEQLANRLEQLPFVRFLGDVGEE